MAFSAVAQCAGVVLAGGLSSRMRRDKALLDFGGTPLVQRAVDTLRSLCDEVLVVTNSPATAAAVAVPTVGDLIPQQGPLSGIHAGLVTIKCPHGIFVACDMPLLNVDFIRYLAELAPDFDVVAPRLDGQVEGMHAVYSKNCIAPIEEALRTGRRKLIGFYDSVRVHYVERDECAQFDPALRMFENVNTREELEECAKRET